MTANSSVDDLDTRCLAFYTAYVAKLSSFDAACMLQDEKRIEHARADAHDAMDAWLDSIALRYRSQLTKPKHDQGH